MNNNVRGKYRYFNLKDKTNMSLKMYQGKHN